jgi:ribosomal protein L11 methyltransferase
MDEKSLSETLMQWVLDAEHAWTPAELLREMGLATGASRRLLQGLLTSLVEKGELTYLVRHGRTCVQRGWQKPLALGKKTQLLAPGVSPLPDRVPVILLPGASFGSGDHPTTRLCIEGIESMVKPGGRMLDVGTGTGVLALAAVRHGMAEALAVDNDPLAVHEAKENVRLNGLDHAVRVEALWSPENQWDLVAANLRPPTLMELAEVLAEALAPGGGLVLSGMREGEMGLVARTYGALLRERGAGKEKGWGSLLFTKEPQGSSPSEQTPPGSHHSNAGEA